MKPIKIIAFSISFQAIMLGQTNVLGQYVKYDGATRKIDIKPNGNFEYHSHGPCGVVAPYVSNGSWRIINDTVLLLAFNDTIIKNFAIFKNGEIQDVSDAVAVHKGHTIRGKFIRDTTYFCYFFPYRKVKGYYETGELEWTSEYDENNTGRCEYHYKSGKLKISGRMKNGKRNGRWKYYNPEGQIAKIEIYKRDKLKRTKNYS